MDIISHKKRNQRLTASPLTLAQVGSFALWLFAEFCFSHTFFSQACLILFSALTLGMMLLRTTVRPSIPVAFYGVFCFVLYLNIRLGNTISESTSRALLQTVLVNLLFFFLLEYFLLCCVDVTSPEFLRVLVFAMLAVMSCILLYNVIATGHFVFVRGAGGINPNIAAIFGAYLIFWVWVRKQFRWAILPFGAFILLSGTRKALLVLAIMLVVYYCFRYPRKLPRLVLIFAVAAALCGYLLMNVEFLYRSIGIRMESLLSYLTGEEGDASILSREGFIELGMAYFRQEPFRGHGAGCFQLLQGAYGTYSHNNFVELLFSLGIPGTVAFYMMHLYVLLRSGYEWIKHKNQNALLALAIVIGAIAIDYAQVTYYSRDALLILFLCHALYAVPAEKKCVSGNGKTEPLQEAAV